MPQYSYTGDISLICREFTISSGQTTSNSIDLEGHGIVGIITPAALTGTAFTFSGSADNETFVSMYNADGEQFNVVAAASRFIAFSPGDFVAPRYMKLVSNASEGADRDICLVLRGFV